MRSIDGVAGGIAVPFACVGDTVLENFFGIGVGEEIRAHQRLVDGHEVHGAEYGAEIATHTLVKFFAGFKQLHPNAPRGQAFLCAIGHDAVLWVHKRQISQFVEIVHLRHDQLSKPRRNDAFAFVVVHFVFVVNHFT